MTRVFIQRRRAAFARFEQLGLPTRQQEAWRLTDLSAPQAIAWHAPSAAPVRAGILPTLDMPTQRLVFVNGGRFAPALSRLGELPGQTLVASLGQALRTHPERIEPWRWITCRASISTRSLRSMARSGRMAPLFTCRAARRWIHRFIWCSTPTATSPATASAAGT